MKPAALALCFAAVIVTASACSSSSDTGGTVASSAAPAPAITSRPTPAAASTTTAAAEAPTADPLTLEGIKAKVEPLGLSCPEQTESALFCSRGSDSWQFRVSPKGDGDRAFRTSACESGASQGVGQVITDGKALVVYAGNEGQDVASFAKELATVGLKGSVEPYC